jgi:hypothetical protein
LREMDPNHISSVRFLNYILWLHVWSFLHIIEKSELFKLSLCLTDITSYANMFYVGQEGTIKCSAKLRKPI